MPLLQDNRAGVCHVLLALATITAGCDGDLFGKSCTGIGCVSGLNATIDVEGDGVLAGRTTLNLELDGEASSCTLSMAELEQPVDCGFQVSASLQRGFTCSSTTAANGAKSESCTPSGGHLIRLQTFTKPRTVSIELVDDAGTAKRFDPVQPTYKKVFPNGRDCDSGCERAQLEFERVHLALGDGTSAQAAAPNAGTGTANAGAGAGGGSGASAEAGASGGASGNASQGDPPAEAAPCAVAERLDACCFAPVTAARAELDTDECLVALTDLGRASQDGTKDKCWSQSGGCAAVSCGPTPPYSRIAELGAAGTCEMVDECETDADCTIASDLSLCCTCPEAYPTALVESFACIDTDEAGGGGECTIPCATICDVGCAAPADPPRCTSDGPYRVCR